jgi:hypothetical protein
VTDITSAPLTGPHLTPMFPTGAQDALAPTTEPHHSPIFDTGPHPDPLQMAGAAPEIVAESPAESPVESPADGDDSAPQAFSELENVDTGAFLRAVTGHMAPVVVPAQSVVVPGTFQFVKRWKFALIVAGVWAVSAAAGLGFYYWWYSALNKTVPVLGILIYLAVCMVASLLVSLVPNRPQVTALAIALMAAPLASTAAAAILHGAYYFEWIARPALG